jgi:PAS domain S-box-containing protein
VLSAIVDAGRRVLQDPHTHEEIVSLADKGHYLLRLQRYRQDQSGFTGLVASLVDVTRILDIEKEMEAILETVSVGICVTNHTGHFVQVNEAYCKIYGYDRSELLGRHFSMVVPESFRKEAAKMHDEFIEKGSEIPAIWEVVDKQGKLHKVAVRASLLTKGNNERMKITVVNDLEREKELLSGTGVLES